MSLTQHAANSLTFAAFVLLGYVAPAAPAEAGHSSGVRGTVLDFQTREPLTNALVSVRGQNAEAMTDEDGHFELPDVAPGEVELSVSTVGYGWLRQRVSVQPGKSLEVELLLGQESMKPVPEVIVSARPFSPTDPDTVMLYTLNSTELQNLSTVLANDPFRAVQSLPGVTANQDHHARPCHAC